MGYRGAEYHPPPACSPILQRADKILPYEAKGLPIAKFLSTPQCPPIASEDGTAQSDSTTDNDGGFEKLPEGSGVEGMVSVVASLLEITMEETSKLIQCRSHFIESWRIPSDVVVGHLDGHLVNKMVRTYLGDRTFPDLRNDWLEPLSE